MSLGPKKGKQASSPEDVGARLSFWQFNQSTRRMTPRPNDPSASLQVAQGPPSDPKPSLQRWGRLEIREAVGRGGFGEIYRAWDSTLEREVALKLLREEKAEGPRANSLVLKEGRLLARLRHRNVATVYGVDRHEGRLGLWMEFIRGKDLEALLQEQGPMGAREAVGIGLDLCRALAAVHGAGLIHGDVKAQNVIREEGGRIVLTDFGLGQDLHREVESAEASVAGTPFYMAPELLEQASATVRSDIYALGVLLFHLVTRSYPVTGGSVEEIRQTHKRGEAERLRDLRSDLPDGFVRVIEHAIAGDPMERFASVGEMGGVLAGSIESGRGQVWPGTWEACHFHSSWLRYLIPAGLGTGALLVFLVLRIVPLFWDTVPKQPERIFVADFENQTDDPGLGFLVRVSLILALEQSRFLNIFPRDRARETLKLMKMPETTRFDPLVARQVCRRENIATLISGEVVSGGDGYQIIVRAADSESDTAKAVVKTALPRKEELYAAVDTLASQLRNSLGESGAHVEGSKPLERVTTRSFEALERFSRGRELYVQGQSQDALILFKYAADLDPEFAMAHQYLALVYDVLGRKDEGLSWATKAYELRERATERERLMIEAKYHELRGEVEETLESYRTATLLYPEDPDAQRRLATYLSYLGKLDEAVEAARRALELDAGSILNQASLVLLLAQANRNDEALQKLKEVRLEKIEHRFLSWAEGLAWLGKDDFSRSEEVFQSMARDNPGDVVGSVYLAQTLILRGEFSRAIEQLEVVRNRGLQVKDDHRMVRCLSWLARLYLHLGRQADALRQLQPLADYQASPSRVSELRQAGLLLAETGRLKEAEAVLLRLEQISRDAPSSRNQGIAAQLRGELEWRGGRTTHAQKHFELARAKWDDPLVLWSLARFLEARGNLKGALSLYQEVVARKGTILRYECGDLWVLANLQAGRCHLRMGNRLEADRYYGEFFRHWEPGGSELEVVKQARRER